MDFNSSRRFTDPLLSQDGDECSNSIRVAKKPGGIREEDSKGKASPETAAIGRKYTNRPPPN
jgi:hypothetical protein